MRGRTVRSGGVGDTRAAGVKTLNLKGMQWSAFQAPDVYNEKRNQPREFGCQSKVLLFLLLILSARTSLQAQRQEAVFAPTFNTQDNREGVDPVASGSEFRFNNATSTVVRDGESDMHPATNRDVICAGGPLCDESFPAQSGRRQIQPAPDGDGGESKRPAVVAVPKVELPDRNLDIYYRNRREFSLDVGWHPVNIPFVYDFAVGDSYNMTPLKYTLVPIVASLRWHVTNVGWRWIFRGNMDFTFSGSITPIPRGPETHYYSFDFGIRRNFVYRNWKAVPFFEQRGGAGITNAKEPLGVQWAQGQNLTFTYNMGAGVRYNLDSKYSFSGGMNYMHISNGYLSQPAFYNYGINVYGPMFGLDIRLGKPHHSASQ